MLTTIIRVLLFLALVAAGTWGVYWLLEAPGSITVTLAGREYVFTPFAFAVLLVAGFVALWIALRLVGLVIAVLRFIDGDETAISRYFRRSRERRGLEAMARAMIALASGDARRARKAAEKAERLLERPELTRLINAQAAELSGDERRAAEYYMALARDPETAFVGVRGLLNQAIEKGDTKRALKLAEMAAQLKPKDPAVLETLYTLQTRSFDWAGARRTLAAQRRLHLVPPDEARRRDAMLALAQAEEAEEAGRIEEARRLALEAARLDPANDEAVATAARHLVDQGAKRRAAKLIIEAWRRRPSLRLASAFAEIEPGESPEERRRRFRKLLNANPNHPESKIIAAELALMTHDWQAARRALDGLGEETQSSARYALIMAAIARGEGAPEAEVRGWLAKALEAMGGEGLEAELRHAALLPLLVGEEEGGPAAVGDGTAGESPETGTGAGAEAAEAAEAGEEPATEAEDGTGPGTGADTGTDARAETGAAKPAA